MAAPTTVSDKFVTVNGLRLHYLEWAKVGAPVLLMLHGLRGTAHGWDGVAGPLADRFHIYALDQRGRGDSDWAPNAEYRADAYVSDIEQLVENLGLERFILVGHSMGGSNTILYTARHPERVIAAVIEDMGPGFGASFRIGADCARAGRNTGSIRLLG
jgi:esterase